MDGLAARGGPRSAGRVVAARGGLSQRGAGCRSAGRVVAARGGLSQRGAGCRSTPAGGPPPPRAATPRPALRYAARPARTYPGEPERRRWGRGRDTGHSVRSSRRRSGGGLRSAGWCPRRGWVGRRRRGWVVAARRRAASTHPALRHRARVAIRRPGCEDVPRRARAPGRGRGRDTGHSVRSSRRRSGGGPRSAGCALAGGGWVVADVGGLSQRAGGLRAPTECCDTAPALRYAARAARTCPGEPERRAGAGAGAGAGAPGSRSVVPAPEWGSSSQRWVCPRRGRMGRRRRGWVVAARRRAASTHRVLRGAAGSARTRRVGRAAWGGPRRAGWGAQGGVGRAGRGGARRAGWGAQPGVGCRSGPARCETAFTAARTRPGLRGGRRGFVAGVGGTTHARPRPTWVAGPMRAGRRRRQGCGHATGRAREQQGRRRSDA